MQENAYKKFLAVEFIKFSRTFLSNFIPYGDPAEKVLQILHTTTDFLFSQEAQNTEKLTQLLKSYKIPED